MNENNKVLIELINDDSKFEKVKFVEPNIKWNRCDIQFGRDFELLKVNYEETEKYIAFYQKGKNVQLGVYMVEIPQYVFDEVINFLVKIKKACVIHIDQSLNYKKGVKSGIHWLLNLPDIWEEYNNIFSSKTRYNRRYYKKKLEENYNCEWKYFPKQEIDENFMKAFYALKSQKKEIYYDTDAKGFLGDYYGITDAYALYIDGKMQSVILYSIIDSKVAYCENLAYDLSLSKYNAGNILFYYSIEKLIEKGIKKLYLGGGDYEYKRNSKAIETKTYHGNIFLLKFWQKIFYCFYERIPDKRITLIILGIKISFCL